MLSLTPDECRVLGVLIEKELTTPGQYPLSLNAVADGCSQKNNREPVVDYDEDRALDAVEGLRSKGLVIRVDLSGSRVPKYKHQAIEKLPVNRFELVILAELLLRGPQTLGELRGRASRMHHLDTLDIVKDTLAQLMGRPEPLVRELPPAAGSRAERYAQLLCPDAHPIDAPAPPTSAQVPSNASLTERIARLESQVTLLRAALNKLATSLGEADPTADWEKPG
jgi:uncharacterized protein YceH (UPF0502 family)